MKEKLTSDELFLAFHAISFLDSHLEKLHWEVVPLLSKDDNGPILKIAKERNKLDNLRSKLARVYEGQFAKS